MTETLRHRGSPLHAGRLVVRPNRFIAEVELNGQRITAHVPDPGRLEKILVPGADVWVASTAGPKRKTDWTLLMARPPGREHLVSLDSTAANRLVAELLDAGDLDLRELGLVSRRAGALTWDREVKHGQSRFDFRIRRTTRRREYETFLEIKSVTLCIGHVGRFPDAPTARGRRHVEELSALAAAGTGAAVLFVAQRGDIGEIRPHPAIDPEFTDALRYARRQGVRLAGIGFRVTPAGFVYDGPRPVRLR